MGRAGRDVDQSLTSHTQMPYEWIKKGRSGICTINKILIVYMWHLFEHHMEVQKKEFDIALMYYDVCEKCKLNDFPHNVSTNPLTCLWYVENKSNFSKIYTKH